MNEWRWNNKKNWLTKKDRSAFSVLVWVKKKKILYGMRWIPEYSLYNQSSFKEFCFIFEFNDSDDEEKKITIFSMILSSFSAIVFVCLCVWIQYTYW